MMYVLAVRLPDTSHHLSKRALAEHFKQLKVPGFSLLTKPRHIYHFNFRHLRVFVFTLQRICN